MYILRRAELCLLTRNALVKLQNVAHVLLNRGRLSMPEICHYTKLKQRSAQGVIIVLIQHNLAWHSEVAQGDTYVEFFEINLKECLMRLRWGRILALTADEFGEDVSNPVIFASLLQSPS